MSSSFLLIGVFTFLSLLAAWVVSRFQLKQRLSGVDKVVDDEVSQLLSDAAQLDEHDLPPNVGLRIM